MDGENGYWSRNYRAVRGKRPPRRVAGFACQAFSHGLLEFCTAMNQTVHHAKLRKIFEGEAASER